MKKRSSKFQFNVALNEDDYNVIRKLRDHYDINVSGFFKRFARQKLEELEKAKKL